MGGTWTDITADSRLAQLITIERGRKDGASRIDPSALKVQIRNPDGKYSPRNPTGTYYGRFGRNTPLRTSIAAGTPWLGLPPSGVDVRASTPSTGALNITGDLDVRCDVQPEDWNASPAVVELGGKWGAAGQRSWRLSLLQRFLILGWSTDGTAETSVFADMGSTPLTPRMVVRFTLDVNNGAGGHTARFYVGSTMTGPWTQVGADQITAGTTATFSSTAPVEFGDVSSTATGHAPARLFAAQIRTGIDGTVVANPVFSAQAVGALTFTDSAAVPWTVNRADGITNRLVRGAGEVPSWPPRWGSSGRLVTASLAAAGITRRLGQGATPLDSTLRRRIPSDPGLIAYWPMEDGTGSTQAYSPLPGVRPMTTTGMTFGQDDSLPGSAALPTLGSVSSMRGNVPASTSTSWHVEFAYRIDTGPAADANAQFIVINTSTSQWRIGVGGFGVHIDVTAPDGSSLYAFVMTPTTGFFGSWNRFYLKAQPSGSNVSFEMGWIVVGVSGGAVSDTFAGSPGHIASLTGSHDSRLQGMGIGHVAVFDTYGTQIFDNADTGFNAEQAATRFVRLATEEGVSYRTPYGSVATEAMGPQRPDTLLNLTQAAADADEGAILYEPRDAVALAWRPRYSLYNQTPRLVLDYNEAQVGVPLEPEDDDQSTRNDITVTRNTGTSARATLDEGPMSTLDPDDGGVGRYTDSVTLNLATDDQPEQHAGWRLHIGTYDGMRFPAVTISLHRCPELIDAAREVDIGDRIQILNPPPWLPPGTIDLIVQGVTEVVGIRTWTMTFNCSPGGPWSVGVTDDTVLGHADTDGSVLVAAVTSTTTVLRVQTTAGPAWTTDPADYPFDLTVGGEVVTATACAPDTTDSFTRTVSSGWGSADTLQAWTAVGGAGTDFSVSSGAGRHLLTSVNVARWTTMAQPIADFDLTVTVSTTALATGASQYVALVARMVDVSNCYLARVDILTTAAIALTIRKRVAGTETQLVGGVVPGLTHTANGQFKLRFRARDSILKAKVWASGGTEPPFWTAMAFDTSFTAAGLIGVRSLLNTGNTNSSPSAVFDDFTNSLPQRITATRSINGVVKAQSAGADIRLANPAIVAL